VAIVLFLFVYLTAMPFLGGVEVADLERLRVATSGLGWFGRLILPILRYERRLIRRKVVAA